MLIIIGLMVLLLVVSIVGLVLYNKYCWNDGLGFAFGISILLCSVALIVVVLVYFTNYSITLSEIEEFKATQQTITEQRKNEVDNLEKATLTLKIIESNQWLASVKYWNSTFVGDMYPDEVNNLSPIK